MRPAAKAAKAPRRRASKSAEPRRLGGAPSGMEAPRRKPRGEPKPPRELDLALMDADDEPDLTPEEMDPELAP